MTGSTQQRSSSPKHARSVAEDSRTAILERSRGLEEENLFTLRFNLVLCLSIVVLRTIDCVENKLRSMYLLHIMLRFR